MVEDDVAKQNLVSSTLKLFEDHDIKMDCAELLSMSILYVQK